MPTTRTNSKQRRPHAEQHGVEQEAHRLHAALDGAGQLPGAALQVVGEGEVEEVLVDAQGEAAAGALADPGEEGIAELGEGGGPEAGGTVGDEGCERDGGEAGPAHLVDHGLEEEGDADVDQLGRHEADGGQRHIEAQAGAFGWPEMGEEETADVEEAGLSVDDRASILPWERKRAP